MSVYAQYLSRTGLSNRDEKESPSRGIQTKLPRHMSFKLKLLIASSSSLSLLLQQLLSPSLRSVADSLRATYQFESFVENKFGGLFDWLVEHVWQCRDSRETKLYTVST